MKMKGAKQVHYDSGPNMTPLVDVVMVILIFLMLAGSFAGATRYLMDKQKIHPKGTGQPQHREIKPQDIEIDLDVLVDSSYPANDPTAKPTGYIAKWPPGEGTAVKPNEPLVSVTNDEAAVTAALAEKLRKFGGNPDNVQVVLKPANGVPYKYIVRVYQAALNAYKDAGIDAKYAKVAFGQR